MDFADCFDCKLLIGGTAQLWQTVGAILWVWKVSFIQYHFQVWWIQWTQIILPVSSLTDCDFWIVTGPQQRLQNQSKHRGITRPRGVVTAALHFEQCIDRIDLRTCPRLCQCVFTCPLLQLESVGVELAFKDAGAHTPLCEAPHRHRRLWWRTIYNNVKLRPARHDAPPGGFATWLTAEPSLFRSHLCSSKLFTD